jgi:hypothetical protein
LLEILLDQFLVRLERSVRVSPEMKTKSADTAEHGHDRSHQNPDGNGKMLG